MKLSLFDVSDTALVNLQQSRDLLLVKITMLEQKFDVSRHLTSNRRRANTLHVSCLCRATEPG